MAYYKYTCTNIDTVTTELYTQSVYDTLAQQVYINANQSKFSIDYSSTQIINNAYPLNIKLSIENIPNKVQYDAEHNRGDLGYKWTVEDIFRKKFEIQHFKCYMITKWDNNDIYTENSDGYYADYTTGELTDEVGNKCEVNFTLDYTPYTKNYN